VNVYNFNDTIVAVSSPTSDQRVIVRITGADTVSTIQQIFRPRIDAVKQGITSCTITVEPGLEVDAMVYLFLSPNSYTGEDIAELHFYTNPSVTRILFSLLLSAGLRLAGPGEFTARAYLNNKIDLAQAEAVNEVITASNTFQLAAAERLLAGHLAETISQLRSSIIDCLAFIEAGLDFSAEDIEVVSRAEAAEKLNMVKGQLKELLLDSIRCESVIDLPAVGIAGAPNAGKSTLLNKLLGRERSIVSEKRKTTRDVLTGGLTLAHCRCVIFDCAGLLAPSKVEGTTHPETILDALAQHAAIEALRNALVVIFCVDIAKTDLAEDLAVFRLIQPKALIPAATKADLLDKRQLPGRISQLTDLFDVPFIPISAKTGEGLQAFTEKIDSAILGETLGPSRGTTHYAERTTQDGVALTARHRQAVTAAIGDIEKAVDELKAGNDELAAMMLRAAHQNISNIEQGSIDEEVLEKIFSRFCIGK
jgi:tRNA modification GTPase